jgi:pilus assembly protein CpaC
MNFRGYVKAGLMALAFISGHGAPALSETLSIMRGAAQAPLKVPLNRAVVLESDEVFAELSVANPLIADIATLSDRTIYVLGKAPGRTTLTLLGPDGRLITNVEVQVTPDVGELKERLSELLPGESISVRTANDGIVLSGTVSSGQRVERALEIANRYAPDAVLNLLVVGGTQQVQLKVRFAEMSRSVSKELSARIGATGSILGGRVTTGVNSVASVAGGAPRGTLELGFGTGSVQFTALIQALEEKGVVRTLAEPNLTALSGQSARFLAGGEIPLPTRDSDGNISAGFRPFGVEMSFTPTVVDSDIINIQLNGKVSSVDYSQEIEINGTAVPAFKTRETSTTIEMRDGQSFAIAGLLQDDFQDNAAQVPWLGDIPILGALFRSASYQRNQSELVIIITVHLVQPTKGEALALPTDRIRAPTENELFLFGKVGVAPGGGTRASTSGTRDVRGQDFSGSYGYVLE